MLRHNATLLIGLLALSISCHAALGEKRAVSVSAPSEHAVQRRAQPPALQAAGVSRQSTVLPTGTTLVEYLDASGTVFAVSWTGPVLPDLPDTLGRYFPQFTAETQRLGRAARAAGVLNLRTTDLVVHSRGRMRHFSGHAYVPGLVPAGLDVHDALR
ncbi:MAG: DUF2844 domain-containing protein [Rhodoferax sp.]|nr:DUF2844 domain-containing protein [Rhodoferax sp.]